MTTGSIPTPSSSNIRLLSFVTLFIIIMYFVYNFHSGNLPKTFDNYFESINKKHGHRTRLASRTSFYLPKARTNYGKFNIRFAGVKTWNSVNENIKSAPSI